MEDRAKKISEAIKKSGYSYAELSSTTGISKSTLQRYATGETKKISVDNIIKIAKALNVSSATLLTEDEILEDLMNYLKKNNGIVVKIKNNNGNETVMSYDELCKKMSDVEMFINEFLNLDEQNLLLRYMQLNELGKERLNERLDELLELPKYQKGKKLRKISEILNDHAYIAADEGGVEEIERDPNLPKISELIDDD